jgi:GTPase involved in cell partitioning and DNA repair
LANYSEELAHRRQVVVLTKIDGITDPAELEGLVSRFRERGLEVHPISSVSGQGIDDLIEVLAGAVIR